VVAFDVTHAAQPRYEVKIPLPAARLPEIQAWIRVHPAHWRVAYPERQVNNIYFDSPDYAGLNANLSGIAERAKLRLRWYGTMLSHVEGAHLELKRKHGMVGWKEAVALEVSVELTSLTWGAFCALLRSSLEPVARRWLDSFPVPVLLNHYQRAYYVTLDRRVRLTVDTALRAYTQGLRGRPNLDRPVSMPVEEWVVVEIKALNRPADFQRLVEVLTDSPVRIQRFSKYVHGMLAFP